MPKVLSDDVPMRALVRETQLAEQLVEVPTIVSWSLLQLITKQNVDIPVPCGGVRGLQGFLPRQFNSAAWFLERIPERIVEQNVDFPVVGGLQDFLPGQSSSASSSSPPVFVVSQMCLGKVFFFALFAKLKKVRSWARTRGRNCSPSRAHPRRQLMWIRCRGWSFWPSSSSSLTRLRIRNARIHPTSRGSRMTSKCSIASSPMRSIVLNNLRPGPTRLQETMMVRGDGIGCSGLVTSL